MAGQCAHLKMVRRMMKFCDYCIKGNEKYYRRTIMLHKFGLCDCCGAQRGVLYSYGRPKPKKTGNKKKKTRKRKLFRNSQDTCHYCGLDMTDTPELKTIDHVIPKSKGGKNRSSNYVLACVDCNRAKGTQDYEVFIAKIKGDTSHNAAFGFLEP